MTQEAYTLWTGEATSYSETDWQKIVNAASARLASFLCLPALPNPLPDDLEELLANFIAGVISRSGDSAEIESKHVRNFTINFRKSTAANAYALIAQNYGDIIEKYSQCGLTINVERDARRCCHDDI